MKILEILKEIFSIHLPSIDRFSWGKDPIRDSNSPNSNAGFVLDNKTQENQYNIQKIKFDNSVRLVASSTMLGVAFLIRWFGEPVDLSSAVSLFISYGLILTGMTLFLKRIPQARIVDFAVCFTDVVGISFAVHFTGGITSPLFFMYFLPLMIQTYHRDWGLILFYGVGGMGCYIVAVFLSVAAEEDFGRFHVVAQLILLITVVSIGVISVRILRQKDFMEKRRLSRMKTLNFISGILNNLSGTAEIPTVVRGIVECLNRELGTELNAWSQIFLVQEVGDLMRAVMDPGNVRFDTKQELAFKTCPAIAQKRFMRIGDVDKCGGCPAENYCFKSQICVPVNGNFNESFGVIYSGSHRAEAFQEEHREFLEFVGRSIGITIQRLKMVEELRKTVEMDSCVTASFLSSTRGMKDAFTTILDGLKNILRAEQASLMLWDGSGGRLVVREVSGPNAQLEKNLSYQMGEGTPGKVFEKGEPHWTSGIELEGKFSDGNIPYKSLLCLPLFNIKGEPIGVVNAWSTSAVRTVSPYDIDLAMTFVTRAAVAIENSRLRDSSAPPSSERAA